MPRRIGRRRPHLTAMLLAAWPWIWVTPLLGAWEWPFEGAVTAAEPDRSGLWLAMRPDTFAGGGAAPAQVRVVASGEVFFHTDAEPSPAAASTAVPRDTATLVLDHGDGFRSTTTHRSAGAAFGLNPADTRLDAGAAWPMRGTAAVAFRDVRRGVDVHPFTLLPARPATAASILQEIAVLQNGRVVAPAAVRSGTAYLVIPAGVPWVRLPEELIVFRSGRVVARHQFFDRPSIQQLAQSDGSLLLHRFEARGAVERFDFESLDFAGNLRRISINIGSNQR